MTLKEYKEYIDKILIDCPEAAEMEVIYSIDAEGNGYHKVYYPPEITWAYEDGGGLTIVSQQSIDEEEYEDYEIEKMIKMVLVN